MNSRSAAGLRLESVADRGSPLARFMCWPDGRAGVLTRSYETVERMITTADLLASLRSKGIPVPRHEVIVETSDATVAVVQERLSGSPVGKVDVQTVGVMVALNEKFVGLLVNQPGVSRLQLHLKRVALRIRATRLRVTTLGRGGSCRRSETLVRVVRMSWPAMTSCILTSLAATSGWMATHDDRCRRLEPRRSER